MLNGTFKAIEKQKKFMDRVDKEFASAFIKQTAKLVEVVKVRKEGQKAISFQLPAPFNESKLQSFPKKNGVSRKMTGTKTAIAAKIDNL